MSTKFKRIVGIYPSTSGNVRVAIEFHDRGDMNFYMTKDGELHIGKTHNEHTLDNPLEAYQEFKWAQEKWRQGNPNVKTEDLTGKMRQMAIDLCIKLQDPIERKKEFQKAMVARRATSTMKANPELNKKLNLLKKNIRNENKDKSTNQQPSSGKTQTTQLPAPANKPETEQPATNAGNDQKVNSPYGGSRIDKFKQKYAKRTA